MDQSASSDAFTYPPSPAAASGGEAHVPSLSPSHATEVAQPAAEPTLKDMFNVVQQLLQAQEAQNLSQRTQLQMVQTRYLESVARHQESQAKYEALAAQVARLVVSGPAADFSTAVPPSAFSQQDSIPIDFTSITGIPDSLVTSQSDIVTPAPVLSAPHDQLSLAAPIELVPAATVPLVGPKAVKRKKLLLTPSASSADEAKGRRDRLTPLPSPGRPARVKVRRESSDQVFQMLSEESNYDIPLLPPSETQTGHIEHPGSPPLMQIEEETTIGHLDPSDVAAVSAEQTVAGSEMPIDHSGDTEMGDQSTTPPNIADSTPAATNSFPVEPPATPRTRTRSRSAAPSISATASPRPAPPRTPKRKVAVMSPPPTTPRPARSPSNFSTPVNAAKSPTKPKSKVAAWDIYHLEITDPIEKKLLAAMDTMVRIMANMHDDCHGLLTQATPEDLAGFDTRFEDKEAIKAAFLATR